MDHLRHAWISLLLVLAACDGSGSEPPAETADAEANTPGSELVADSPTQAESRPQPRAPESQPTTSQEPGSKPDPDSKRRTANKQQLDTSDNPAQCGLTRDELFELARARRKRGIRWGTVEAYVAGGQALYSVTWLPRGEADRKAEVNLSLGDLGRRTDAFKEAGYRPVSVSGCVKDGSPRFAAVWEKSDKEWFARAGLEVSQLMEQIVAQEEKGLRLISVDSYYHAKTVRYVAVWEKGGPTVELQLGLDRLGLIEDATARKNDRQWRPIDLSGCDVGDGIQWLVLWEKSTGKRYELMSRASSQSVENLIVSYHEGGSFSPVAVAGYEEDGNPMHGIIFLED